MVGTDRRFDVDCAPDSRNGVIRSYSSAEYELAEDVEGCVEGVTEAASLPSPAEEEVLAVSTDVLDGSRLRRVGRPFSVGLGRKDAFSLPLLLRLLLATPIPRPILADPDPSFEDEVDPTGRVDGAR